MSFRDDRRARCSRRRFLGTAGLAGAGALLPLPWARAIAATGGAFAEVPAAASGIHWRHVAGISPQMYEPETNGAGCAFLDYDGDGWMDIYLVNSGRSDFYTPPHSLRNALYRNNHDGTFTDVTEKAGVSGGGYGMGVAVGDYDGDGHPDLYVTQYGRNILYHNNGDGTFSDVTERAGVAAPGWSTSAVWFDYDNDGRLDLFVCQFAKFDPKIWCGDKLTHQKIYCRPNVYPSMPSWLFHNNGDGTFTDVSKSSGIAASLGKAWGVVAADVNNDGWMDLFVANDTVANFLFMNHRGRFEETGALAGVGYSEFGLARSGMGVDAGDYDQDGWLDLFVSNIDHEMFALYRNQHDGTFSDAAASDGIAAATLMLSGWGVKFFDFDNDGNPDLMLVNGHPEPQIARLAHGVSYDERPLLFRGDGRGGFVNVSAGSGAVFQQAFAGRGLAVGDFDNDGAVDALISVNDAAPILLRNQAAAGRHWLGVRLIGKKSNPDAIGAKLTYRAGDLERHRWQVGGGSFLSAHDPRLVLGLGARRKLDWLEVRWPQPGGSIQRFTELPVDRYITITEGDPGWK
ncbi:MAG TPA: CRTAC1 family protein [Terriglobales bacterium]|nr:CRTAC1 family protein [Terriglobales bacterium]